MLQFAIQLTSIVFMGIALVIVFALLLQDSSDPQCVDSTFLSIHQTLAHRYGRTMGIAETGAFIATLSLTILFEGHWLLFFLSVLALICVVFMIGIWSLRIYPINKRVDLWEVEAIPKDWPMVRSLWHRFHLERAAFGVIGMVALIATLQIS